MHERLVRTRRTKKEGNRERGKHREKQEAAQRGLEPQVPARVGTAIITPEPDGIFESAEREE
jgi:hypothetical protein